MHYGMQTGSGTWDLQPSLTYLGQSQRWSWGGQLSGVIRGDGSELTPATRWATCSRRPTWVGRSLQNWLSASVRGVYTKQDDIDGAVRPAPAGVGPDGLAASYGGEFWDIGLGSASRSRAARRRATASTSNGWSRSATT